MNIKSLYQQLEYQLGLTMGYARTRLAAMPTSSIDHLLWLSIIILLAGTLIAHLSGGYQGGFIQANQAATLFPGWFWTAWTQLGNERFLLVLLLLVSRRYPEIIWVVILSAVVGVAYSRGLKHLVDAVRPPGAIPNDLFEIIGPPYHHHSFPSGHSTSIFLVAGVLSAFTRDWKTRILIFIVASVSGFSRVAVGVHWPQDVVAGAFGGLLSASIGLVLAKKIPSGLGVKVHLGFLIVALACLLSLFLDDDGYPSSVWLIWPVAGVILIQTWNDYWPFWLRRSS